MKKLWFKRKRYGWGWYPSSWEGWLVMLVHLALIILFSFTIDENSSVQDVAFTFFLPILILTSSLIGICYKTGEAPRWQWGEREEDPT